ncbi:cilia- and flagella-associated protein HOATZ-like [Mytilus californianus]|uniref:cilia- and flagella-associated protein HOATZ-like n=1 Tax=Mytilus californianus TaxID=6549 RepID=UPI002246BD3A|nr:cilia- and flagella-associated protein HOATZ-like [Mytilus californianus]
MAVTIDLTRGEVTEFSGSSEEDINYAKTFWQSVQLQPPVESRLVSSDIKQRLRVAPSASQSGAMVHMWKDEPKEERATREFLMRAQTMEKLEEYERMQKFAKAMEEDKQLVKKHREDRIKKEEISRGKSTNGKKKVKEAFVENDIDNPDEETNEDALRQLDQFDKNKFGEDSDSD